MRFSATHFRQRRSLPLLPAEERRSEARGGWCSFGSPPRFPWAERPPQGAVTHTGAKPQQPITRPAGGQDSGSAGGRGGARYRAPPFAAVPSAAPALRTRVYRPSTLSSVAPAHFAPWPVWGPGKCGGCRCQCGLWRGSWCLLRFSSRALVLSPSAQRRPLLPSAGDLKFTAVCHSSSRCGRKRLALKGRRQECGAGKRKAAWSGAACLPAAPVLPTPHGERLVGDGGEG